MNAYPIFNEEGDITHVVEVVRDISKRKKMEEQILKQEKLSVLIEMAGATAHELNQPLTVILPTLEQALTQVDKHHPLFKRFKYNSKTVYEDGRSGQKDQ